MMTMITASSSSVNFLSRNGNFILVAFHKSTALVGLSGLKIKNIIRKRRTRILPITIFTTSACEGFNHSKPLYFMKYYLTYFASTLLLIAILSSCKERKPTEVITPAAEITTIDSSAAPIDPDSITSTTQSSPNPSAQPSVSDCAPNFNLIAKPKAHHYIFYVTGFNQQSFKCWVLLEEHGHKVCEGNNCVVYFMDDPKLTVNATLPHYFDDNSLKTHGIGRYEYNGKYWEIKGANIWKRTAKGYAYYNTDNQLGG